MSDQLIRNPLQSIEHVLAHMPNNIPDDPNLAWIYGICCGWDPEDGAEVTGAMQEVATTHKWDSETVARLRILHKRWLRLKKVDAGVED